MTQLTIIGLQTINDPHGAYPDPNRPSQRIKRKLNVVRGWDWNLSKLEIVHVILS